VGLRAPRVCCHDPAPVTGSSRMRGSFGDSMIRPRALVPFVFVALTAASAVSLGGCTRMIPNTTVPDTSENRAVLQVMERYRHAVEERDVGTLLGMADPMYLDEVGTPTGEDDLDHGALAPRLAAWASRVIEIRFEIRYHRVTIEESRVIVEYRYTASFKMPTAEGGEPRWSRRVADARAILNRHSGSSDLTFLSGL
jgi:hypothetical protein